MHFDNSDGDGDSANDEDSRMVSDSDFEDEQPNAGRARKCAGRIEESDLEIEDGLLKDDVQPATRRNIRDRPARPGQYKEGSSEDEEGSDAEGGFRHLVHLFMATSRLKLVPQNQKIDIVGADGIS